MPEIGGEFAAGGPTMSTLAISSTFDCGSGMTTIGAALLFHRLTLVETVSVCSVPLGLSPAASVTPPLSDFSSAPEPTMMDCVRCRLAFDAPDGAPARPYALATACRLMSALVQAPALRLPWSTRSWLLLPMPMLAVSRDAVLPISASMLVAASAISPPLSSFAFSCRMISL